MSIVKVQVIKTYYKSTTVEVNVPDHITDDEMGTYLEQLDSKTAMFSDALADASLSADMDGTEIDNWEKIYPKD